MKMAPLSVKLPCKICRADAPFFGDSEFSIERNGQTAAQVVPVAYYRCSACEFLFSDALDSWTQADFAKYIYNDGYASHEDFVTTRPSEGAEQLARLLAPRKGQLRIMDYGGGKGAFAERMNQLGFETYSYDPFYQSRFQPRAGDRFELVYCREVIEHSCDPHGFVRDMLRFLTEDAVVFIGTVLQPEEIENIGLEWTYAAPGSGHVSLFSGKSMTTLWHAYGFSVGFYADSAQLAWRGNASFLPLLAGAGG